MGEGHAHLQLARQSEVPFVLAGHTVDALDEQENSAILLDVEAAAAMALQVLAALGHRSVAFCPEPVVTTYQRRTIAAAESCAASMGLTLTTVCAPDVDDDALDAWLRPGGPTAFLAQPPRMARRILLRARGHGLEVPRDLSLITIGRAERLTLSPALSQVVFDLEELGRQCARILMSRSRTVVHRRLSPAFLPGETLGPPRS